MSTHRGIGENKEVHDRLRPPLPPQIKTNLDRLGKSPGTSKKKVRPAHPRAGFVFRVRPLDLLIGIFIYIYIALRCSRDFVAFVHKVKYNLEKLR